MLIIPYVDQNPEVCAQVYTDEMVKTMPVEIATLLSCYHNQFVRRGSTPKPEEFYKSNEVSSGYLDWLTNSGANVNWLRALLDFLGEEHKTRFDKDCVAEGVIQAFALKWPLLKTTSQMTNMPCIGLIQDKYLQTHNLTLWSRNSNINLLSITNSFRAYFKEECLTGAEMTRFHTPPAWVTSSHVFEPTQGVHPNAAEINTRPQPIRRR